VLLFCCQQKKGQKGSSSFAPRVVEAHGYVVPKDSMAEPKVVPAGKPKVVKVGIPKVVLTNTNVHRAGSPKVVIAGTPRVCTPGQDSFLLPKTVPVIDSPFPAGIPEMVIAKDAHIGDDNPYSFSSFGELHGLKRNEVNCLLQDNSGNIWFGTFGGGVTKYDGKYFTNYFTRNSGLFNDVVLSILQDKKGNIWFGTFGGGVSKYDGKYFTHYTEKEGLSNNSVWCILQDKRGNIWFGTSEGITKYDGKSTTQFTRKQGLSGNRVSSILQDTSGNFWFGTDNGVSKYDGKSFTNFTEREGLSSSYVSCILQDKDGSIWFGTKSGACKYDGKSIRQFTEKEGLSNNFVRSILQDKKGNIWFGTNSGGVSKYDGKLFTDFSEREGLNNNSIGSILQDKSGNLWFGTEGGACKYNGLSFTHFTQKEGLSNNKIFSILLDKSGNLWLISGAGVCKYDGKSFRTLTPKKDFNNNFTCILQEKSGDIWFGSIGDGVGKYDGKSFAVFTEKQGLSGGRGVRSILEDNSGNIWFATYTAGISKYDGKSFTNYTEKEGLIDDEVECILQDKIGNYWFGAHSGVTKYNGKSFTQFNQKEGLNSCSIFQDKKGNLWFGTFHDGIYKYDGTSFTHFTEKEGLVNNSVRSILQDKSGNIWFGTWGGLSKLSKRVLDKLDKMLKDADSYQGGEQPVLFKNYTYEDGLLGIHCSGGMAEDSTGTIWVGTYDRLTAFHPEGDEDDTIPPNIQLTSLQLFNENIPWTYLLRKQDSTLTLGNGVPVGNFKFDSLSRWYGVPEYLSLAYNNNYLTFNYIGITISSPKKVKYKYRLDGIDDNWSALTSSTEAPYGNLPQGTYTFRVKARNGDGYWSNEYQYTFSIRPPWWKTWWAYTAYILIALGSIAVYVRWRTASLLKRQKELEQTVDERTAEVVAEKKEVEKQFQRSEELLLNILPSEVAEELKAKGSAEAKTFDDVTVLFTDFKGFTNISERLTAKELVAEIDYCFKGFDAIIGKYNIEKIKTIGDSYMAAGGLPVKNKTHAADVVNAALEIRDFMDAHKQQRMAEGKEMFEIRIGIHTGPVVAGIVGVKKFAYDIWGDTVNTASRMESSGEAGKVNISATTYELVKDKFTCSYRGKVEAKKKGMVDMYFVDGIL